MESLGEKECEQIEFLFLSKPKIFYRESEKPLFLYLQ